MMVSTVHDGFTQDPGFGITRARTRMTEEEVEVNLNKYEGNCLPPMKKPTSTVPGITVQMHRHTQRREGGRV